MAEFPKSWFSSPDSESDTKSWTFTRPIPIPETIKSWGLSLRPRRVPNRETRCVKSESPFYSTKSWSKNVQILWFLPSPSKFRFQIRFRVYNDLKIESDSETVTSPEPRVSVFRVQNEGLRKFCPEATFWKFKILLLPMLTLRSKQTIRQGIKKLLKPEAGVVCCVLFYLRSLGAFGEMCVVISHFSQRQSVLYTLDKA